MSLGFVVATILLLAMIFVVPPVLVYLDGYRIGLSDPTRYALLTLVTGGAGVALYLFERERIAYDTVDSG